MEFRNQETFLRQKLAHLKGNPLGQVLFLLVGLVLVIPILALVVLGIAVFLLWQIFRIVTGRASRPGVRPPTPAGGSGPVIDVEVTRRETR